MDIMIRVMNIQIFCAETMRLAEVIDMLSNT